MFPAIMPWPLALAPTNEAIRCENHVEKNHDTEKINHCDLGGHGRCNDSITIKEA